VIGVPAAEEPPSTPRSRPQPFTGALVPPRSAGVLVAPLGEAWAVYDLHEQRVSVLNPGAGVLLVTGGAEVAVVVADVAAATGAPPASVEAGLRDGIEVLRAAGLLDRPAGPTEEGDTAFDAGGSAAHEPRADTSWSGTGPMFGDRLALRGDADLVAAAADLLGLDGDDPATICFDVHRRADGSVRLRAAEEWVFVDADAFLVQLPGVVNDVALRRRDLLVLHAGGVRTPDGSVLVFPGEPDAGKSTLTAALVRSGCDLLGDELIGLRPPEPGAATEPVPSAVGFPRPILLDERSRGLLGLPERSGEWPTPVTDLAPGAVAVEGDVGPPTRFVLPVRDDDAPTAAVTASVVPAGIEAVRALLPAVLNLSLVGEPGWVALCRVASEVPVERLTYRATLDASQALRGGAGQR
jgi:hypothetical protein